MENTQLNALGEFKDLDLFDKDGNKIYSFITHLNGDWSKRTYNSKGNTLTFEDSDGFWYKCTYDLEGNQLTHEDSDGERKGFDIPEFTMEEVVEKIGYNFKIKK